MTILILATLWIVYILVAIFLILGMANDKNATPAGWFFVLGTLGWWGLVPIIATISQMR